MNRFALIILIAVTLTRPAAAHDPYEITSVVYVRSNVIELLVEMEFPAGMTLAGTKPVRDVAVLEQFEAALPKMRELAGGFFELTAGNNVVPALTTNVELGVENHIRFEVNYAPSAYRPLKFVARGLGPTDSDSPYGTSLTVLDMVHQKVLGQETLFASKPTAEFPPRPAEIEGEPVKPDSPLIVPATKANPPVSATPLPSAAPIPSLPKPQFSWQRVAVLLTVLFAITFIFFRRHE